MYTDYGGGLHAPVHEMVLYICGARVQTGVGARVQIGALALNLAKCEVLIVFSSKLAVTPNIHLHADLADCIKWTMDQCQIFDLSV